MNSRKIVLVVVVALLVLVGSWLLPSSADEVTEKSLVKRVEVLEEQVADLLARVAELEEGGAGSCTCDVLHLTPLADFPENPSEGDLCVVTFQDPYNGLFCYLQGDWKWIEPPPPPPPPPITPPPTPPVLP